MQKGLKSLVEISAWVLFIFAWVMLINVIVQSWFYNLGAQWTMVGGLISMVSFLMSAIVIRIRKNLE